jgi:hypothetical protein
LHVGPLGRHYVKLTLPLRKAATLLRERELFYGLPTVGPTGMGLYSGKGGKPGHRFVGMDRS